MSTQSIIDALAGLKPDADKAALMSAVDDAVNGIVKELGAGDGKVSPDVLQATQTTLTFLQACGDLGDPEFTERAKTKAAELLDAFGKVTGDDADAAAPKKRRRRKRPPGAKAKGAPDKKGRKRPGGKKKRPPKAGGADKAWEDTPFTDAFTQYFCKFIRKRAMLWFVPQHDMTPTPYPLTTRFGDNLESAIKEHFMHRFFSNRRIMVLDAELKGKDYAETAFMEEFEKPKKTNVVRGMWEDGLVDIKKLLTDDKPQQDTEVKTKTKTKKTGGFLGFFQKEEKIVERQTQTDNTEMNHAKGFWDKIAGPHVDYVAPIFDDFEFLMSLFEYYPPEVEEEQEAVKQMLQQEFGSSQAREGAARDHLNNLIKATAPCSGELTALWAYLTCKDEFTYPVFKSFTSSHGTTAEQRARGLPYFQRFLPDFTEMEGPNNL